MEEGREVIVKVREGERKGERGSEGIGKGGR